MLKRLFALCVMAAIVPSIAAGDYDFEYKGDKLPSLSKEITQGAGVINVTENSFARMNCALPAEQGSFTFEAVFNPGPMPAGVPRYTSQVISFVNRKNNRTNADFVINQYPRDKRPYFVFMFRQTNGKYLSIGAFHSVSPDKKTVISASWDKENITLSADGKVLRKMPRTLPFIADTATMVIGNVGNRKPMPMQISRIAIKGSDPAIVSVADKKAELMKKIAHIKHVYTDLPCDKDVKNVQSVNGALEFKKDTLLRTTGAIPADEGAFIFEGKIDLEPLPAGSTRRTLQLMSISSSNRTIADFVINQYPRDPRPYFVFMVRQSNGNYLSIGEFADIPSNGEVFVCAYWDKDNLVLTVNGDVLRTIPRKVALVGGGSYMVIGNPYKSGREPVAMKIRKLSVLGATPAQKKNN